MLLWKIKYAPRTAYKGAHFTYNHVRKTGRRFYEYFGKCVCERIEKTLHCKLAWSGRAFLVMETFNPRQRIKDSCRNFQGNYANRVEHHGAGFRGPCID